MKVLFCSLFVLMGFHGVAFAQAVFPFQSTGDITPRVQLRATPKVHQLIKAEEAKKPQDAARSADEDQIIVPELKKITVKSVNLSEYSPDSIVTQDMQKALQSFLHHPLTFKVLDQIKRKINALRRVSDQPFSYVYIPPQKILDGKLIVLIEKYHVGSINVTGNTWFSSKLIRYESRLRSGMAPSLNELQSDVAWLNRNPFRAAEIVFSPGSINGETDADISVSDRFPVYGFAGANNQNDPSIGRNGWYVGASWGNAFNLDQILTYQYNATTTGRFFNHSGAWQIPLGPRDSLLIFGNYAKSHPFAVADYENYGGGASVSIRWMHMVRHFTVASVFGVDGTLQLGYDWKTANSYQMSGKKALTIGNADLNQIVLFYSGSVQDPFGKTEITNQMAYGPGGLTRRDNQRAYETLFPGSGPGYFYDRLSLSRSFPFTSYAKLNLKAAREEATKNLLYSEQLSLGGIGTVRGYYLNTSFGSRSTLLSAEVASRSFSIGKTLNWGNWRDETTLAAFWDYGNNTQIRQVVAGIHSVTLSSVGASATSKLAHQLNGTLDVGWRLRRARSTGSKGAVVEYNIILGL